VTSANAGPLPCGIRPNRLTRRRPEEFRPAPAHSLSASVGAPEPRPKESLSNLRPAD
jgi:hypothetical protein